MDCAVADDGNADNDEVEYVSRFCPLLDTLTNFTPVEYDPNNPNSRTYWTAHSYDFAHHIFDYFTVIAPHDDYFPNLNPDRTPDPTKNNSGAYRYYDGGKYRHDYGAD